MTDKKIAYEPHPVSPERKAELRAAGFKIIDAVYAPKDIATPPDDVGLSDDELRAAILTLSGKAAHHKAGRDKLLAQYNALTAAE